MKHAWEWLMERPGKPRQPPRRISSIAQMAIAAFLLIFAFTPLNAMWMHWDAHHQQGIRGFANTLWWPSVGLLALVFLWAVASFVLNRHRRAAR